MIMCITLRFTSCITKCIYFLCWPICTLARFLCIQLRGFNIIISFIGGFGLGQLYNYYFLKKIPFSKYAGIVSLAVSLFLGIGSAVSVQLRCTSLLTLPMYCGKPGRSVLKAVVLTYVVAGPITNMGLNAREVVRVFACSTQLSYNLSRSKYAIIATPLRKSLLRLSGDIEQMKHTLRSISDVINPIENEIEGTNETVVSQIQNDYIDDFLGDSRRSQELDNKYRFDTKDEEKDIYQKNYLKKLEIRCENQFSRAVAICMNLFPTAYKTCRQVVPAYAEWVLCWPMKIDRICNIRDFMQESNICDSSIQVDPGLGEGYAYLKKSKSKLTNLDNINLQYKITCEHELYDVQNAKETGKRVLHAFEEKYMIMRTANIILNICMALLFLRIFLAAVTYHDMYLTVIEYDNIYITRYFKKIDQRRRMKNKHYLLPLKKMERSKYVDVHSLSYVPTESNFLVTHILKVMLEVVTATTFVMLDRLFYEALDVVRQHAEAETTQQGMHDLQIEVEGIGPLAKAVRKVLEGLAEGGTIHRPVTNKPCLPQPRLMSPAFFFKIYGGYLWIVILLYLNPYTLRLKRLICSYFYPRREKQRILHLYNNILKKRMKMEKTLRRKAVQAVRSHYLSGENLLSMRIKFPRLLGWLRILPAARMTCLICGETEPRMNEQAQNTDTPWYSCAARKCPFVYCLECWREVGARCLACDPSLAELSDIDSLSEDEHPKY